MIVCINAATGGISEWDLDWLGIAGHEGTIHGITEDETLATGGESEADFLAEVRTGELSFGSINDKSLTRAYLELFRRAACTLYTSCSRYGETLPRPYPLPVRAVDGDEAAWLHIERLARGIRGPWWTIGLSGTDWELGSLSILVNQLSRKG